MINFLFDTRSSYFKNVVRNNVLEVIVCRETMEENCLRTVNFKDKSSLSTFMFANSSSICAKETLSVEIFFTDAYWHYSKALSELNSNSKDIFRG